MNLHVLFITLLISSIITFSYLLNIKPNSNKLYSRLGVVVFIALIVFYIIGMANTMNHVSYKKIEELDIFFNEADQKYYFNHHGKIISLQEACSQQYRTKIPPHRIQKIPQVTVYEKKYLPKMGVYYGNKKIVYVHGFDARINHQIELK